MRKALKSLANVRLTYIATFDRYGDNIVSGNYYPTMLFTDIRNVFGDYLCDHIWTREVKMFSKLKLKKGDKVMFSAISKIYQRGYKGENPLNVNYKISYDYRLIHIRNVKKIK